MKSRIKKCHETGFFIHEVNNMGNETFWKAYKNDTFRKKPIILNPTTVGFWLYWDLCTILKR